MKKTLRLDGVEYQTESLSENAKSALVLIEFIAKRVKELRDTQSLLQRAKNSYLDELKKEILASKAGFFIDDD